ncbi:MAG: hypothetical protein EA383_12790 [Spirochaetaceae bacterium]|nr:MAG: hypothetical protein EA383_12790 [Spirochaetaceae bacterium]
MKRLPTWITGTLLAASIASCAVLPDFDRHLSSEVVADVEAEPDQLVEVRPLPDGAPVVHMVSGHASLVVATGSTGEVWRWGAQDAELGSPPWAGAVLHRDPVAMFTNRTWSVAVAGAAHLVLVSGQGELFTWGNNAANALGLGEGFSHVRFSVDANRIAGSHDWVDAYAFGDRSYAITSDGHVFAWGNPAYGALGIGDLTADNPALTLFEFWGPTDRVEELAVAVPERIASLTDIESLAPGRDFVIARDGNGRLYGWGRNSSGSLGLGDRINRYEPDRIPLPESVTEIAAGEDTAFAITESGLLYGWGSIRSGAGSANEVQDVPMLLFPQYRWLTVASGRHRGASAVVRPVSYGVSRAGYLYFWDDATGEPARVAEDPGGWVRVLVTETQIIGLRSNGAVYTWQHGEPVPSDYHAFP